MQVNRNLIPAKRMDTLLSRWKQVLDDAEIKLTRILWEFYSLAYNFNDGFVDKGILNRLLECKTRKLSRCIGRRVTTEELHFYPLRHCRRYRHRSDYKQLNNVVLDAVESNVVNLSTVTLSDKQKELLSLGLSFVPAPREFERYPLIRNIKGSIHRAVENLPNDGTSIKCFELISNHADIQKYVTLTPNTRSQTNINKTLKNALKELNANTDIKILPADKGSKTVIW
ncbi:hypothetical protein GJ496_011362, partial [Pomphorhynchus laevis]